jgi:hypothetical protein
MKFEKYASRRTYAGIQRINAISRNRTRNEERNSIGDGYPDSTLHWMPAWSSVDDADEHER